MLSTVIELLFDYFRENHRVAALLIYTAALLTAAGVIYRSGRWKGYGKTLRGRLSLGLVIALHLISIEGYFHAGLSLRYGWLIFAGNLAVDACVGMFLKYVPSRAMQKMKHLMQKERQDPIKAYQELTLIDTEKLSAKDQNYWKQRYGYLLIELGSIRKAAEWIRETNEKDSAWYKMFLSLQAEANGNLEKAKKKMKQALNALKEKEDDEIRMQIFNNYGRMCRIYGNHLEAFQYYGKAADLIRQKTDKDLIHIIYSNLILTACVLKKSQEEIRRLWEEYRNFLNEKRAEDRIALENLKIEFGEQEMTREFAQKSYDEMQKLLAPESMREKRICYEVSSLRVIHMAMGDPKPVLDAISRDMEAILQTELPQRYYLMKEIHSFPQMPPLPEEWLLERYKTVFETAEHYMKEQAGEDLERHLASLPAIAVYAYGNTQMELAGLEQIQENYDFSAFYARALSVRSTYEENMLKLEAMMCSLRIVDELFSAPNVDENGDTVREDALKEALEYAEKTAQLLQAHPAYAEAFLKLAYGYIRLCEYEKGSGYYRRFQKCNVAAEHYTVWVQHNIRFVQVVSRVEEYRKILKQLKHDQREKNRLSEQARKWLEQYPECSDEEVTLLFGGLLKEVPVLAKRLRWLEAAEGGVLLPKQHFWLCYAPDNGADFTQTVLELDLCMDRVAGKSDAKRILYFPERHPLQTQTSALLYAHREQENPAELLFLQCVFPEKNKDGTWTYLAELRNLIWKRSEIESKI